MIDTLRFEPSSTDSPSLPTTDEMMLSVESIVADRDGEAVGADGVDGGEAAAGEGAARDVTRKSTAFLSSTLSLRSR